MHQLTGPSGGRPCLWSSLCGSDLFRKDGCTHESSSANRQAGITAPTHVFETQCPSLENPAAERSLVGRLAFFRSSQSKTNCGRESEVMFMNVAPDSRRKRRPYFIRSLVRRVPCSCAYWRDAYVYVLAFPLSPAGYGTDSTLGCRLEQAARSFWYRSSGRAVQRYIFTDRCTRQKQVWNRGVSSFAVTRKSLLSWLTPRCNRGAPRSVCLTLTLQTEALPRSFEFLVRTLRIPRWRRGFLPFADWNSSFRASSDWMAERRASCASVSSALHPLGLLPIPLFSHPPTPRNPSGVLNPPLGYVVEQDQEKTVLDRSLWSPRARPTGSRPGCVHWL